MKIKNIGFKGIGSFVPLRTIANKTIDLLDIGTNAEWTKSELGIEERHAVIDLKTSDLAYLASLNAIKDANINKNEIDLIILATSTPDRLSPSTASIVSDRLGIKCPAFDINAVCSGFIYGLQIASNLISSGEYKNILLVASETYTNITNWKDRNCVFFGDGAGAVIVSNNNNGWITSDIYGDGTGKDIFTCYHNSFFKMNGKEVSNFATKTLPEYIKKSLLKYNLTIDDISWMIPHQPSIKILIKTAELINLPIEKVIFNMKNFANTAGASIPMALDVLYKEQKLKNGDILLMPTVGSGWTWGISIIKYIK